jgi:type IV secretory pathway VirB2 component (pilin)
LSYAFPSRSLADPAGSGAAAAAVEWIEGTLLGTAATSVAVVSVAALGLMMLSGRIDARRAATVILGCFILFGAPAIAAALHALAGGGPAPDAPEPVYARPIYPPPPPPPPPPQPPPRPRNPDPQGGASLAPR